MKQVLLFFLTLNIYSQNSITQEIKAIPDSLKNNSYEDFRKKAYKNQNNPQSSYFYSKVNLFKAKKENNSRETIYGYDLFAQIFRDFNESLKYSDSAIFLANKKYRKALPYLYFTRGNIFYKNNKLKEALNNFLIASNHKTNLSDLKNKIDYSIGLIKKTQGNYKEAIPIYKKCVENALKYKDQNYPMYLLGLAELYNRINEISLSEKYTNEGIIFHKNYEFGEFYEPYFISNRGKNYFQRKEYNKAITDLKKTLTEIKKNNDFPNYSENCFYIAQCYTSMNENENAINFYKQVDSIFKTNNYVSLLTINAYNKIIDYYKKRNNYKEIIYYSEQLIKADRLLDEDYKYITSEVSKNYDIQKVVSSKQKTILSLNRYKKKSNYMIIFLFVGLIILGILFYIKNKGKQKEIIKQRQLFESYIKERKLQKNNFDKQETGFVKKVPTSNIDGNVIKHIIDCLKKFERDKLYLNSDLTVDTLALEFKTNSNYLSKVVNEFKGVNFTQYINTLRIKYIIDKLETDKKYLNYTIQGLSEFSGFNSTQTFTRAFINCTKMNPSEYIKELKKTINSWIDKTKILIKCLNHLVLAKNKHSKYMSKVNSKLSNFEKFKFSNLKTINGGTTQDNNLLTNNDSGTNSGNGGGGGPIDPPVILGGGKP